MGMRLAGDTQITQTKIQTKNKQIARKKVKYSETSKEAEPKQINKLNSQMNQLKRPQRYHAAFGF